MISSTELLTDQGETLDLLLDPLAVVKNEVTKAVQRWRWRDVEVKIPQLKKGGSGAGALMEPLWKLLRPKANDKEWNPALRGSLRSAMAGRQYPPPRAMAAGWADHNKCLFCLHDIVSKSAQPMRRTRTRITGKTNPIKVGKARRKVKASAEQIARAPVGNLGHIIWNCQAQWMSGLRDKWADSKDTAVVNGCCVDGHPSWERALRSRPSKPMKSQASEESFRWEVDP